MKKKSFRVPTIAIMLLLIISAFSVGFAEWITYGESYQVNPQRTSIVGSGSVSSGYGSLSQDYLGYSLGGGVRAEWLANTNAFSGTVKIQLFKKTSPGLPIAEHSAAASLGANSSGAKYPTGSYYIAGYAQPNLDIYTNMQYQYRAVSTDIPSTVRIQYLCFLYYLG